MIGVGLRVVRENKIEIMDTSNHFGDFSVNGNRELEQRLVKNWDKERFFF